MLRSRTSRCLLTFCVVLGAATAATAQTTAQAGVKPPAKAAGKPTRVRAAPMPQMTVEPRAIELLKASSARLAAAKAISFTATVGYEFPSQLGPPIVYTTRYDVTMQRPDRLRVVIPGDGPASEFYFDGKTMMAFAPKENLVAVADAPPQIDAMLAQAYDKAAIFFPFGDFLATDPFTALAGGVKLAFVIGQSAVVGGVPTDMVAWANDDVFLQIWIGADDKLPRRMRAIYKRDAWRLRHEMEITHWQLDPVIAPEAFTSAKALAAPRMAFSNPAKLPPDVKPLAGSPAGRKPAAPATAPATAPASAPTKP